MTKRLTRILRRFLTGFLWLVSVLVIIFVVLLSIVKLSLPYWTEDKQEMVALVEGQFGGTFDYSELEVDWSEFKPTIFIKDASWKKTDDSLSYGSESARVVLNFWESLFKGYLVTESIELNDATAEISIPESSTDTDTFSLDIDLLLKRYPEFINQERIDINGLTVNIVRNEQSRKVQFSTVTFEKLKAQRQLVLDFQSDFSSQTKLIIESQGRPLSDGSQLKVYGLLRDFDVRDSAPFLNLPEDIPVELADTEFWLEYQGKEPISGRLIFKAESSNSKVAQLDAEIHYQKTDNTAAFSSDKFYVAERTASDELLEYDSSFKAIREVQDDQSIQWVLEADNTPIGYFFTLSAPFIPAELRELLSEIEPDGELVSLDIRAVQDEAKLIPKSGSAEISNFTTVASQYGPQLFMDSIRIEEEDSGWRLTAKSKDSQLSWPSVFKGDIPIDDFSLNTWVSVEEKPLIKIDEFSLTNRDAQVAVHGSVQIEEEDAVISLYGETKDVDIAALEKYWPRNSMSEEALQYLDQSLLKGKVEFARLVWRGGYEAFPYEDSSGVFDLRAKVHDASLKFDPDWPQADQLSAQAHFKNNQLFLASDKGQINGHDIGQASGVIDSVFTDDTYLTLEINNKVGYELYNFVFQNSPLQEWLGPALLDLTFSGNLEHQLKLEVPLSDDDADAAIDGKVLFNGENVHLDSYGLALESLNGELNYTQQGAHGKSLKGRFWQSPVSIDIAVGDYGKGDDLVNIDAISDFNLAKAVASFDVQLPIYVEGQSQVNLHYRQDSEGAESLIVRSDLKGTEINGPSWFSKSKDDESSFLSTLYRKNNRIHARTIYRDTVSSQLSFDVDSPDDINGVIALGDLATHSIDVPARGVAIRGFFAEIHSDEWLNSLQVKKGGTFFWPKWIDHISIKTALFTIAGQSLHDVELTDSLLADESVRFNVKADEGYGNLTLHQDGRKHVTVEKLDIELDDFSQLSDSEVDIEKSSLDNWQIECLACKINGIDTGKLTLVSKLDNGAVVVQGDSQIEGQLKAYLEGRWQGDSSRVEINFETLDTGALLKRWGFGDGLKDTKANGNAILEWPGGFHDISIANISGSIDLETGEGSVKELSDRQARVFSLFSLQSIRRRLSLDFSDLFEDGFFYDKIKGVFTINKGVVHSDNVFIDGAAADVRVKGTTNLVKKTVDQNVTVVPKLGSSLPVLAGWAIEPTTGLIMLLVNKLFEPVIDVVVSIEYKISGDLNNPTVIELNKKSKEVPLPEVEEEEVPQEPQLESQQESKQESEGNLEDSSEPDKVLEAELKKEQEPQENTTQDDGEH
ncbi:YhdP family protein [Kangiella spongicola]|uniref:TIGR02099 family protein n=1 Tax=Kangiella spongicola TaxID=796379 RepID=A0A318D912_9GAMM|nr:YhdP family protein [Kangiella spongicola]PXF63347.1 TIGR02099 family protein [Kangiella spongicola]